MISINSAVKIVQNSIKPTRQSVEIKLSNALNYVLFEDIMSPINMPPFRQSAMDGYALNLHDEFVYNVIGEVKAGDAHQTLLKKGEAVRIFTGAAVPDSANAIIIQEHVSIENTNLIANKPVTQNANIRALGEQVEVGDLALKKGTKLNAAAIGYLASLGVTKVKVHKKPTITIIVTGNELVSPGKTLNHGQIYESNAIMLSSTLNSLGFENNSIQKVDDNYDNTEKTLKKALAGYDVVLISGGISVGDYDFVGKALLNLGVEQLFYKVKQKPGKPLFFGKKEETVVFALPGNPASVLSCFYIYVYNALEIISGVKDFQLKKITAKASNQFNKKGDRPQFLKAIYEFGYTTILEGQNSSMLHTFALANALAFVPEDISVINKDDSVEVILLPLN